MRVVPSKQNLNNTFKAEVAVHPCFFTCPGLTGRMWAQLMWLFGLTWLLCVTVLEVGGLPHTALLLASPAPGECGG